MTTTSKTIPPEADDAGVTSIGELHGKVDRVLRMLDNFFAELSEHRAEARALAERVGFLERIVRDTDRAPAQHLDGE